MYNILLADDEKIIRESILNFIPWEALDCTVVFEATNGVEAKNCIESQSIDIAVLDIRMPGINGLDLAQYVCDNYPKISVIMLTAYTDFQYIQKALRCAVVDYVIKTNFENELSNAIEKAISSVNQRCSTNKDKHQRVDSKTDLPILQLMDALEGQIVFSKEVERQIPSARHLYDPFCVAAFKLTYQNSGIGCVSDEIVSVANEHLAQISDLIRFLLVMKENLVLVVVSCPGNDPEKAVSIIQAAYFSLLVRLDLSPDIKLTGGVSSIKTGFEALKTAYSEALHALELHKCEGGVHKYDIESHVNVENFSDLQKFSNQIINDLNLGAIEKSQSGFEDLVRCFEKQHFSLDNIKASCIILCSIFLASLSKHGIILSGEEESVFYSSIRTASSRRHIYDQLTKILNLVLKLQNDSAIKYSKLVEDTREYLISNYKEKLTLCSIANRVHVSASYLCRVFKNETGSSIIDTLNSIRIEKAKTLLEKNECKVSGVACQVGINDPGYFTHVFSRYTGMSPKDYFNRKTSKFNS